MDLGLRSILGGGDLFIFGKGGGKRGRRRRKRKRRRVGEFIVSSERGGEGEKDGW